MEQLSIFLAKRNLLRPECFFLNKIFLLIYFWWFFLIKIEILKNQFQMVPCQPLCSSFNEYFTVKRHKKFVIALRNHVSANPVTELQQLTYLYIEYIALFVKCLIPILCAELKNVSSSQQSLIYFIEGILFWRKWRLSNKMLFLCNYVWRFPKSNFEWYSQNHGFTNTYVTICVSE